MAVLPQQANIRFRRGLKNSTGRSWPHSCLRTSGRSNICNLPIGKYARQSFGCSVSNELNKGSAPRPDRPLAQLRPSNVHPGRAKWQV